MTQPVLSIEQMYAADHLAQLRGLSSYTLMENAGVAVAKAAMRIAPDGLIAVLCGPGNNGGDGWVAAEFMRCAGRQVRVYSLGDVECLKGDAERAFRAYAGTWETADRAQEIDPTLIVDALYGAGLSRPLEGYALNLAQRTWRRCLAVDVPSGIHGDKGVVGPAFRAEHTLTFAALKPAHLLSASRVHCGHIEIADIGIGPNILAETGAKLVQNTPTLWWADLPTPELDGHKHQRGHLLCVTGGPLQTGAARLAASAGLRIGAGLVTLVSPPDAAQIVASTVTEVMVTDFANTRELSQRLHNAKAIIIGPAAGVGEQTCQNVLQALKQTAPCVIDADGLTSFESTPERLFQALRPDDVLTPHIGEFRRLFPGVLDAASHRIDAARAASNLAGCVVLLKGADTVVAATGDRQSLNAHASPWLATAGSGDVLAGLIGGLLAQGMPSFSAASAAVWLHGDIGVKFGPGLIAQDLVDGVPAALKRLSLQL